jgi:hypothetical protein
VLTLKGFKSWLCDRSEARTRPRRALSLLRSIMESRRAAHVGWFNMRPCVKFLSS